MSIDRLWQQFGFSEARITRLEALSVPAMIRGRNLICSVATLPLLQYNRGGVAVRNPLLDQLDPDVPNVVTLSQTIEDLLFESISWWLITAQTPAGYPLAVRHIDVHQVRINHPGRFIDDPLPSGYDPHRVPVVYIDGVEVPATRVIRFDSPNPPVLKHGARALRRAVLIERLAETFAESPRPLDYFTPADGADDVLDTEVEKILSQWRAARRKRGTAWVPRSMKYNSVDSPSPQDLQLVQLQQRAGLDIANMLGVDPEDLGISTTSRTYANNVDRKQDRVNDVLSPYMLAISQRLTMGDITPGGNRVAFDIDDYLKANPKDRWTVYQIASNIKDEHGRPSISVDEIRAEEDLPPLPEMEEEPPVLADPNVEPGVDDPPATDEPVPSSLAGQPPQWTMSADDGHTFINVPMAQFKVDSEARTIEGLALPYGPVVSKYGLNLRFAPGSLQAPAVMSRVKMLIDHDPSQAIGYLAAATPKPNGMFVKFQLDSSPEADRALQKAKDKVWDGLSVGVDFDLTTDTVPDPQNRDVTLVRRTDWSETSLTAMPAFDDARLTRVVASKSGGNMEECASCGTRHAPGVACPTTEPQNNPPAPAAEPAGLSLTTEQATVLLSQPGALQSLLAQPQRPAEPAVPAGSLVLSADQVQTLVKSGGLPALLGMAHIGQPPAQPTEPARPVVNPTRPTVTASVLREELPYRFDRGGNLGRGSRGHDFSSDLIKAMRDQDGDALKRAEGFVAAQFDVAGKIDQTDVQSLNPTVPRPDLFVDQRAFTYPLYSACNKGGLDSPTPFVFPVFSSSSGLVGAHTEGTEPSAGDYKTTATTITPSAMSGKVSMTREVYDAGGNPQASNLLWGAMQRGWYEAAEAAVATILNGTTLTAQTIALSTTGGEVDAAIVGALEKALAKLQFARGGFTMRDFFIQADLYAVLVDAKDSTGRRFYPLAGAMNANGSVSDFFGTLNIAGTNGHPTWALAAAGQVNATPSYLIDTEGVSFWSSAPNRLSFEYQVATIDIGIWGYKAGVVNDVTRVRKLTYDPVAPLS